MLIGFWPAHVASARATAGVGAGNVVKAVHALRALSARPMFLGIVPGVILNPWVAIPSATSTTG